MRKILFSYSSTIHLRLSVMLTRERRRWERRWGNNWSALATGAFDTMYSYIRVYFIKQNFILFPISFSLPMICAWNDCYEDVSSWHIDTGNRCWLIGAPMRTPAHTLTACRASTAAAITSQSHSENVKRRRWRESRRWCRNGWQDEPLCVPLPVIKWAQRWRTSSKPQTI